MNKIEAMQDAAYAGVYEYPECGDPECCGMYREVNMGEAVASLTENGYSLTGDPSLAEDALHNVLKDAMTWEVEDGAKYLVQYLEKKGFTIAKENK